MRDFTRTTGAASWNWRPTAKIRLGAQYTRDTGQEFQAITGDVNRAYAGWRVNASYALSSKVSFSGSATRNRSHREADSGAALSDAFDNDQSYSLGVNWAVSRGISLSCQYNRASRDSSVVQYTYSAHSLGCSSQLLFY